CAWERAQARRSPSICSNRVCGSIVRWLPSRTRESRAGRLELDGQAAEILRRYGDRSSLVLLADELHFLAPDRDVPRRRDSQLDLRPADLENFNLDLLSDQERFARAAPDYEHTPSATLC